MIKVLELFAGIGACSKALTNLGIEHEIVDAVEIDKYAVKSFNAIHGTNFEPQDITEWDKDIECDLIMHGSPCQDFSVAGKGAGGDEGSGTRSSLMYETLRIVEKLKPKYVIWENVKNLLSKKHRHNFEAYQAAMQRLGYNNYYQVLNAKDYGVPQHRERVFTVSIRNDGEFDSFYTFPEPMPLEKKLKDVLDDEVDEKYYLSEEQTKGLQNSNFNSQKARENSPESIVGTLCARDYKGPQCVRVGGLYDKDGKTHQAGSVYDPQGIAATLSTMQGGNQEPIIIASRGRTPKNLSDKTRGIKTEQRLEPNTKGITNTIASVQKDNYVAIKTANKLGYDLAQEGDAIDLAYPNSTTRRGRVGHGVSKTLECSDTMGTLQNYRIHKLTPKEKVLYNGLYEERYKESRKVLPILWEKIGEEAFSEWAIRGLWCILSESVLWKNMYAKGIFENWLKRPELVKCSFLGSKYKQGSIKENDVRNMWVDWQDRYPSYRQQLSEQQFRQLKSVVQKLPHEVASFKGFVQSLWETDEGSGVLRKALSEIQEIWKPDASWEVQWPNYRIRKLTPLSCWRLMGFDDIDFEKAEKVNSNTQLYKQAGNSIVVNVLEFILAELLKEMKNDCRP